MFVVFCKIIRFLISTQFIDVTTLPEDLRVLFGLQAATPGAGATTTAAKHALPAIRWDMRLKQQMYHQWLAGAPLSQLAKDAAIKPETALYNVLKARGGESRELLDYERLWNEISSSAGFGTAEGGALPMAFEELVGAIAQSVAAKPVYNKTGTVKLRTVYDFIADRGAGADLAGRFGSVEALKGKGGRSLLYSLLQVAAHAWQQRQS